MENQLNGAATTAKKNIGAGINNVKQNAKEVASEVTSEIKSLSDVRSLADVQAFAASILGGNFENVDEVKAQIRKSAEELEVRAKEYSKTAASYVKKNPGIFAALAAGIALWFVASLFRGNRRD